MGLLDTVVKAAFLPPVRVMAVPKVVLTFFEYSVEGRE